MNYFLWQNGSEFGPYDKQSIIDSLSDGGIPPRTLGRRENDKDWKPIESLLPVPIPQTQPPQPPPTPQIFYTPHVEKERRNRLKTIRATSAYGDLRTFIRLITVLVILISLFAILLGLARQANAVVGFSVILIISTTITRALSLVLIDIADILLHK